MRQIFLLLFSTEPQFKQVSSIVTRLFIFPAKNNFSTQISLKYPETLPNSAINQTHKELSSVNFSHILRIVISKCSDLWNFNEIEHLTYLSLKDYFVRLHTISPETIRSFWRVDELNSQDVLEILLGFESDSGNYESEVKKVESLWGIFKLAGARNMDFEHCPRSCKTMAEMLVRVGLFREAEYLLGRRECQEIQLDCHKIFNNLTEGYVRVLEFDRAILMYERMRTLRLVPSRSSYHAVLKCLTELNETELVYHAYVDMIEMGMEGSDEEKEIHENVVKLLCIDGKVHEARGLVKKAISFGIKPGNSILNSISFGYCEKKNYDDLLSFFTEVQILPDTKTGNKIIFSICSNFGSDQAKMFLRKMEELSFFPDHITFGILIGSSCREERLKDSFLYLSEIKLRSLKPHLHSYNALLSGILKKNMWMHSHEIFNEMNEMGVTPDLSTFRVLIAGLCKSRKFDEVKAVIIQMEDQGLLKLLPLEDQLSRGFALLGIEPSTVKIKRDNDKASSKTEFYDVLGNGLYLDTDIYMFEEKIDKVIGDAMVPDFNSTLEKSHVQDVRDTLEMVDEMGKWGQEMSLTTASLVFSRLCAGPCSIDNIIHVVGVIFKRFTDFDEKTLNLLVETFARVGLTFKAHAHFDVMVRRDHLVRNSAYSALLSNLGMDNNLERFQYCHELARKSNWSPKVKDAKSLFGHLCKNKWFSEALQLLDTMMFSQPESSSEIMNLFLKELCYQGLTTKAAIFLKELQDHSIVLDHMAYCLIVRGFCLEKKFAEAFPFLDTMLLEQITPPLDLCILLIPKLCTTNNFEKAVALKDILLKEHPSAVIPILSALIKGSVKFGRIEEGEILFKGMLLKGLLPDSETFNGLTQIYCQAKNLTKVEEFLGAMIRRNVSISISSYSNMVRLMCGKGIFSLALNLKDHMHQATNLPLLPLYNILIFHVSSSSNRCLLDAFIATIQKKGLQFDDVTYNMLIRGHLLCNNVSLSHHHLMSMINQNFRPSNRSLREVIRCLCFNGELKKVMHLSEIMESRGWIHGSVIQNIIAGALIRNGKLNEARHFLDRMESNNLVPKNVQYDYLIKQFYLHGRLDKAAHLINIMLKRGSSPDSITYDYIVQGLCNYHELDRALDFHSEMLNRKLKPSFQTWDILVRGLSKVGQMVEAEKLMNSMIEFGETPSREMFCSVINKYHSENNSAKASEVLKVMQERGYEPDFDTHWSVIHNLKNSSQKDDSKQSRNFLSGLLSGFGFDRKNSNSKAG